MTGIVIVAFILGGFVLGPAFTPKPIVTPPATVTVTETMAETVTATPPSSPIVTETAKPKWLNPSDPNVINWADAGKYIGKTKTVEGTIVRTYRSSTNTVFLNLHDPYQGYFYAVIFASDLKSFPFKPEEFYRGKEVRINGLIKLYQGSPEIIVEDPSQIEVAYMGYNYP
jgi:micrococcal nuclease